MEKEKSIINSKLDELSSILYGIDSAVSVMQSKVLSVMTDKMDTVDVRTGASNTPRVIQSDVSDKLDSFILNAIDIKERITNITKNIEL